MRDSVPIVQEAIEVQTAEVGQPAIPVEERQEASSPAPLRQSAPKKPAVKTVTEIPRLLEYPYRPEAAPADSTAVAADSVAGLAADTLAAGEIKEGIVLVNPAAAYRDSAQNAAPAAGWGGGMSWIYLGLSLLFCIIGIKFKGSARYLRAILSDLTDTRVRHNAFDETVRETSQLILLNILWIASAGILLWVLIDMNIGTDRAISLSLPPGREAEAIALCMAVVAGYQVVIFSAYWMVGNIFSDRNLTRLWVKGAGASSALEAFVFFPVALVALNYPAWAEPMLLTAAATFIAGKIVFLYKGFRIFFTQISSWLLFLYYLCSLEIVPLILTYVGAVAACSSILNTTA